MKHLQPFCELSNMRRTKEINVVEHQITHREMIIIVFQMNWMKAYTPRETVRPPFYFLWS